MTSTEEAEYAAFEEKVERTVYLDNLSHLVTESVLRTALNQFGDVQNVEFIPNYTEPKIMPRCALVEMGSQKQANQIIEEMSNLPFMISGMPRPVRARNAEIEMFDDRPRKPGRRITCRWLDPQDPDFQVAKKIKTLVKKQSEQAAFLLKLQLAEEEKKAEYQEEILKAHYTKFQQMDGVTVDGSVGKLASRYGLRDFNGNF